MKVLIVNAVLLNGGDAAILRALMQQVRDAFGEDVEIEVGAANPAVVQQYYPDLSLHPQPSIALQGERTKKPRLLRRVLRFPLWYAGVPRLYLAGWLLARNRTAAARALVREREWKALRSYTAADLIISTGGTYLVEHYWLGPIFFNLRLALLLKRPLVLYTQSMGPFRKLRNRRALCSILRRSMSVLLRDERSLASIHEVCGALELAHVVADSAFALADPAVLQKAARPKAPNAERPLRVAVSVREWPYFETVSEEAGQRAYRESIAAAVAHLIERYQADVTFISTCQGVPEYRYDDAAEADCVVAELPDSVRSRVTVDRAFHRPEALLKQLGTYDLVIATRMHMAILSLSAGTPVLPVAYEFKTRALFERLGMAAWVRDIEQMSPSAFVATVDAFVEQMPALRPVLFAGVQEERRRAVEAVELFRWAYRRSAAADGT